MVIGPIRRFIHARQHATISDCESERFYLLTHFPITFGRNRSDKSQYGKKRSLREPCNAIPKSVRHLFGCN